MNQDRNNFFWPSYVDLMTALFLVMLVLFVLSYKQFQDKQKANVNLIAELKVKAAEKEKLDEIQAALKRLEDPRYFAYNQRYKRYELNFPVEFQPQRYDLPSKSRQPLIEAGRFLLRQMRALDRADNVQYLVVVEGRAAKNPALPDTDPRNLDGAAVRQLSYNRAMEVIRLWESAGLRFPNNLELVAAGSGFKGVGRYTGFREEAKNKRFIIQIQPKIGSLGK
jgi:curved DNA-binding protein CbpA